MLFNIMAHVLSDTTRHAGHADILREQLDGSVGIEPGQRAPGPGHDSAFLGEPRCATIGAGRRGGPKNEAIDPLLAEYVRVAGNRLCALAIHGLAHRLSDGPCRSPLWSGVVVRLLLCEQGLCQAQVRHPAPSSPKRLRSHFITMLSDKCVRPRDYVCI